MTPLLAVLEFGDYAIIAVIVIIFARGASFAARQRLDVRRLERKLDALLQHHGVSVPSRLSPEVQRLAKDPAKKIAAIKLHREQKFGLESRRRQSGGGGVWMILYGHAVQQQKLASGEAPMLTVVERFAAKDRGRSDAAGRLRWGDKGKAFGRSDGR